MLTTKYVWTLKGQKEAEMRGLETRLSGQVASFAYRPLEQSPTTARAWEEDGIVERLDKERPFLNFNSKTDDEELIYVDMIHQLHENDIRWRFKDFLAGKVEAAIISDELVPLNFHRIEGNLYMITEEDSPLDLLFRSKEERSKAC
jgi:hypothetical protein